MCRRRWKKLRRQHHWKRPRRRRCWSSTKALLEKVEVTALLVEAKALVPLWRRSHQRRQMWCWRHWKSACHKVLLKEAKAPAPVSAGERYTVHPHCHTLLSAHYGDMGGMEGGYGYDGR
jgi:hypothetical protein